MRNYNHIIEQIANILLYGEYSDIFDKEYNGFTDNRQVIIWSKDGKEFCRSESGRHIYSFEFKKMCCDKIIELFNSVK